LYVKLVLLWLALLAVAVGLPLLALAADRADARRVPTGPGDLWAFSKEHGLSAVDAELVRRALDGGHSLEDPRLRRLVALRVGQMLPRAERHQRLLAGLVPATLVVAVVVSWATRRAPVLPVVVMINPVLHLAMARFRVVRLRRAALR
jgi:hypothetical protein